MLYVIGALSVIAIVATWVAFRLYGQLRVNPKAVLLGTLPILAIGATKGHWAAAVPLIIIAMAVLVLHWR